MTNVAPANELNTALSELVSQDPAVRKRAAAFLGRKPCMDLLRRDAPATREWFIDPQIRERMIKAIYQEQDEKILFGLLQMLGNSCKYFAITSFAFGESPTDIDYLKASYKVFHDFLAHPGQSIRLIAAVGLCVFRSGEAWDILLDILRGKPKSDEISRISIMLFYHSSKRIQAQDENSAKMIDILNEMGIAYHPQGLSDVQTEAFRSALQAIYPQLKNNDVRESIEKALRQLD